ncbi:MAG: hypothetical protein ACR2FO_03755 [Actinomycetota bacterium]
MSAGGSNRGRRRRRKGAGDRAGLGTVIDSMSPRRPTTLTLPPDGTVLEDLIADMEAEYGTPATPQEYRLIVKVAPADEPVHQAEQDGPPRTQTASQGEKPRRRSRGRRRRRGRRGPPAPAAGPSG